MLSIPSGILLSSGNLSVTHLNILHPPVRRMTPTEYRLYTEAIRNYHFYQVVFQQIALPPELRRRKKKNKN